MVYGLILLILLVIIAPIIAIMPSPKQKAIAKKRKQAREAGVRVDLVSIDDPDPDPEKYLSNTGRPLPRKMKAVAWRKYQESADADLSWVVEKVAGGMDEINLKNYLHREADSSPMSDSQLKELRAKLIKLPSDVLRFEQLDQLRTVYWLEEGDAEAVIDVLSGSSLQQK